MEGEIGQAELRMLGSGSGLLLKCSSVLQPVLWTRNMRLMNVRSLKKSDLGLYCLNCSACVPLACMAVSPLKVWLSLTVQWADYTYLLGIAVAVVKFK